MPKAARSSSATARPLLPGEAAVKTRPGAMPWCFSKGPSTSPLPIARSAPARRDWSESWAAADAMPEQIRLTIADSATGRLRIPVIVQSLLVDAEVECAAAPAAAAMPEPEGAAQ